MNIMTKEQIAKCCRIAEHYSEIYGEWHQYLKAVEEMSELIQAIMKRVSGESPDYSCQLVEEYADVLIMMQQIKTYMYNNGQLGKVRNQIEYKLNRQLERIENGE